MHHSSSRRAGVPFFFKQWGGVRKDRTAGVLNSRTYDELPQSARRGTSDRPPDGPENAVTSAPTTKNGRKLDRGNVLVVKSRKPKGAMEKKADLQSPPLTV